MWNAFPFVRYCLALMLGIGGYLYLPCDSPWLLMLPLATLLAYGVAFGYRKIARSQTILGLLGLCLIAEAGYCLTYWRTEANFAAHYTQAPGVFSHYQATVESLVEERSNSWKATAEVQQTLTDGSLRHSHGKVLLYFDKKTVEKPHYGDVLLVKGQPTPVEGPKNPEEFDYRRYLSYQQVYRQHYLKDSSFVRVGRVVPNRLVGWAYGVNNYADSLLTTWLDTKTEYAVANAMILGLRDDLDNDLVQAYSAAGAIHVLSVSGLHVGVIYVVLAGIFAFLKRWGRHGRWLFAGVILAILWFYAVVSGLSSPVLRSTFMFSMILLADTSQRPHNSYNTVAFSAFWLLCYNPYFLVNVGFQLSYLAVFGMIHIQPMLNPWVQIDKSKNWAYWLGDRLWKVTTVAVAAQIATLPITIYYFHQFPNYFLFANPIVILLSSIALCVGLGFVVVSVILPDYLLSVISYVLNKSIWALNETVLFTERLPYSIFKWLYVSPAEMVTLNLLTVSLLALLSTRRVKYVWLNIVLLLGLLGYNAVEKNQERRQHTLAIHAVPKHTAVSIIDGTHALLLSDAEFLQDRRNVSFRLNNFWAAKGITDTTKIHYFGSGKGTVQTLQWRGKSFVFLSQSLRQLEILPSQQPVDYLVVANKAVRHLDEVLGKIPFRRLVIDGSYSAFYTQQLLQEAQALGVEVYPIYTKGALVLSD